jgi:hypothetical protein
LSDYSDEVDRRNSKLRASFLFLTNSLEATSLTMLVAGSLLLAFYLQSGATAMSGVCVTMAASCLQTQRALVVFFFLWGVVTFVGARSIRLFAKSEVDPPDSANSGDKVHLKFSPLWLCGRVNEKLSKLVSRFSVGAQRFSATVAVCTGLIFAVGMPIGILLQRSSVKPADNWFNIPPLASQIVMGVFFVVWLIVFVTALYGGRVGLRDYFGDIFRIFIISISALLLLLAREWVGWSWLEVVTSFGVLTGFSALWTWALPRT